MEKYALTIERTICCIGILTTIIFIVLGIANEGFLTTYANRTCTEKNHTLIYMDEGSTAIKNAVVDASNNLVVINKQINDIGKAVVKYFNLFYYISLVFMMFFFIIKFLETYKKQIDKNIKNSTL